VQIDHLGTEGCGRDSQGPVVSHPFPVCSSLGGCYGLQAKWREDGGSLGPASMLGSTGCFLGIILL
jgi:hypothetical protein